MPWYRGRLYDAPMPRPPGLSPRSLGLLAAALLAAVFAGVIWYAIATAPPPGAGAGEDAFGGADEVPTLEELEEGASMLVTIADRDDPSRVAGTLEADQFEPIGAGKRRLRNPEAWIYARSGRAVRVTARSGVLLMPDPNEAPESGTLEGDVTIRVYASTGGAGIPAPADAEPELVARFDEPVSFERRYLRLRSEGAFTITSARADFSGADLTVMLNDLKNRVELIEVVRGERLVLRPEGGAPLGAAPIGARARIVPVALGSAPRATTPVPGAGASGKEETDTGAPGTGAPGTAAPGDGQTPIAYHAAMRDAVRVELVGTGTLESDTLDIWANTIGGALPEGAIRDVVFSPAPGVPGPTDPPRGEDPPNADAVSPGPDPGPVPGPARDGASPSGRTAPVDGEDRPVSDPGHGPGSWSDAGEGPLADEGSVVIVWDGPLVVRPIDTAETALKLDDVVLEVRRPGGVGFSSGDGAVTGSAPRVRYHATRAVLGMHADGDPGSRVELGARDAGEFTARELIADLARGTIDTRSRGTLATVPGSGGALAEIAWEDAASFAILMGEDGSLTDRLTSAFFTGGVLATRADARVEASTLRAEFSATARADSSLRSVELSRGSISAEDGSLRGDSIRLGLAPDASGSGVTPTTLRARGSVVARSDEGRVEADALDALLGRDARGAVAVRRASAEGGAEYLGANDTTASGARLEVDPVRDTVVIAGEGARTGQGESTIFGDEIRINTRRRSVRVDGAGRFEHAIVADGRPTGGHLRVSWGSSMRFDDALGTIECEGAVEAISTPDALTRDTLKAARVEIELSPVPIADPVRMGPEPLDAVGAERELLVARAFGRALRGGGSQRASVESRSYDPDHPERASGVLYLEGAQIIADNERQTLRVPGDGTLLVMDRSRRESPAEDPGALGVGSTGPGLTRVTWDGTLELDRATGRSIVRRGVAVRHKSLETARVSDLLCDELEARFTAMGAAGAAGGVELLELIATGRVEFIDADRTLLADRAVYDAVGETLFASASGDRMVTLRDAGEPTPVSARTLLWDLIEDAVEIDAPSPVRAPVRP